MKPLILFAASCFSFLATCAAVSVFWAAILDGVSPQATTAGTLAAIGLGMALAASGAWVMDTVKRVVR